MKMGFEGRPALPSGQPSATVGQLMPDWRRDRAFRTVLVQTRENGRMRPLRDWGRYDTCVEKVTERHTRTLRPVVLSRVEAAKSLSTPIASSECCSTNFLSLKCRRVP